MRQSVLFVFIGKKVTQKGVRGEFRRVKGRRRKRGLTQKLRAFTIKTKKNGRDKRHLRGYRNKNDDNKRDC